MVEAAVLVRAFERHDVYRLLDDTDDRAVAPYVRAHLTDLLLGEIPALAAEPDSSLDLLDRASKLDSVLGACGEQMESQTLCGAAANSGQLRELGDQVLDRRTEHARSVAVTFGQYAWRRLSASRCPTHRRCERG